MNELDTGEFDLDLTAVDTTEAAGQTTTPAIVVDVIDDDPPELDVGDFVFVGWQPDI